MIIKKRVIIYLFILRYKNVNNNPTILDSKLALVLKRPFTCNVLNSFISIQLYLKKLGFSVQFRYTTEPTPSIKYRSFLGTEPKYTSIFRILLNQKYMKIKMKAINVHVFHNVLVEPIVYLFTNNCICTIEFFKVIRMTQFLTPLLLMSFNM
jgi:hypothetical protein